MAVQHVFAGIPVADYTSARDWYERLFGRPPDLVPNETEAAWQLSESAWIYVVADADRAGDSLLTILVNDLEAQVSQRADRAPGLYRKAEIRDADGNTIAFGEDLSGES